MSEADPSHSSRYFKLGLFVLIGTALIVAAVIVLGAGTLFQTTIPAETYVNESVNGLEVGSAVKYRGVTIGKVTAILFAAREYDLDSSKDTPGSHAIAVEMSLQPKVLPEHDRSQVIDRTPSLVKRGLRARVATAGLGGQCYIEVDYLDPDKFPVPPISWTPNKLYLPSAPSTISTVLDAAEQIATDLQKANIPDVINNIRRLTANASAAVATINDVVQTNHQGLGQTVADLPQITQHLKSTTGRADQILHDPHVDQLLAQLPSTGKNADATLVEIRQFVRDAQVLLASESDDLRSLIVDLRRTADNAATVTDDARQNPARVLFGDPPPRKTPGQ